MPKMIQNAPYIDGHVYTPTSTWLCESELELQDIPSNVSSGSIALILTNEGLTAKMKNSSGNWITI